MAKRIRCPECGSRAVINISEQDATKNQVKGALLNFGVNAALTSIGAGGIASPLTSRLANQEAGLIKYGCACCKHKWMVGQNGIQFNEYNSPVAAGGEYRSGSAEVPSIGSFQDISLWLNKIKRDAGGAVGEAISAQMLVVKFAQSAKISDGTADEILASLKKALSLSGDENERKALKQLYGKMIADYALLMEGKMRMIADTNYKKGREVFTNAGYLLRSCIEDLSLLSGSISEEALSRMEIANVLSPEKETHSINSFFRILVGKSNNEGDADSSELDFYNSINDLIRKLDDNFNLLGESKYISAMITGNTPWMEQYLNDVSTNCVDAYLAIRKWREKLKIALIILIPLALIIGLIIFGLSFFFEDSVRIWFIIITIAVFSAILVPYSIYSRKIKEGVSAKKADNRLHIERLNKVADRFKTDGDIDLFSRDKFKGQNTPKASGLASATGMAASPAANANPFVAAPMDFSDAATSADTHAISEEVAEKQYVDFYNVVTSDGDLSERDIRMLEKYRIKCGISEERARELEGRLSIPKFSDNEMEYMEIYRDYYADGVISEHDRRMLDMMRKKLGIDRQRADRLEEIVRKATV